MVILELIKCNIIKGMQVPGRRIYLPRNILKVVPARGRRTYLSLNIIKEMPARGRITYPNGNIFQDMQARGRRTYMPRNISKVVQARGWRTYQAYRGQSRALTSRVSHNNVCLSQRRPMRIEAITALSLVVSADQRNRGETRKMRFPIGPPPQ